MTHPVDVFSALVRMDAVVELLPLMLLILHQVRRRWVTVLGFWEVLGF